jgi:hypothetical protein
MIPKFTQGNPETVSRMNELVENINRNRFGLKGDPYILIKNSPTGTTISLALTYLKQKLAYLGGGGTTTTSAGITWATITQSLSYDDSAGATSYKATILTEITSGSVQSPFTSTSCALESSASIVDDFYNDNYYVTITAGVGIGQSRLITDYDGTTQIATVAAWDVTPDDASGNASEYTIYFNGEIQLSGTEGFDGTYSNIDPREWVPWFLVGDIVAVAQDADDVWRFVQKLSWVGVLGTGSLSWNETDERLMAVAKGTVS